MPPLKKKNSSSIKKKKPVEKKKIGDKKKFQKKTKAGKKKVKKPLRKPKTERARQLAFLTVLGSTKSKRKRDLLIEFAEREDIDAVIQCVYNLLAGNIKLNNRHYNKLKRYKETFRYLVNTRVNNKKRKAVLKQKGGFLSLLIPLAVSLISGLVGATR